MVVTPKILFYLKYIINVLFIYLVCRSASVTTETRCPKPMVETGRSKPIARLVSPSRLLRQTGQSEPIAEKCRHGPTTKPGQLGLTTKTARVDDCDGSD